MSDRDGSQWYTNKELFERLGDLKDDFSILRSEMNETRALIKSYNGLREEIQRMRAEHDNVKFDMQKMINEAEGSAYAWNNIRVWGGWLFGLITLFILIMDLLE